jgi:DNA polymerase-3 subunit delta'
MASLFEDDEDVKDFDALADEAGAEVDAAEPVDIVPRANPDLTGHEAAEKRILDDFNAGRMPHALVIAGPEGIGKATLAYRLARFLFSQKEEEAGLFGAPEKPSSLHIKPEDPVFRRVASGGHADLLTIEREYDDKKDRFKNDISAESARSIAPFLHKTAAEGGWRIVIVDGAEYLNGHSQNALLKILEEPPSRVLLILTTTQPGSLLPTIRSRCRTIRLEPLPDVAFDRLLDKMAPGMTTEERGILSRLGAGSIGRALRYHRDGGLAVYKDLLKVAAMLPALDAVAAHDLADKIGRYGNDAAYDAAREILTAWCVDAAREGARGSRGGVLNLAPRDAFGVWEKMSALFRQAESYNLDKRQAVLNAFLLLQNPEHQGLNV